MEKITNGRGGEGGCCCGRVYGEDCMSGQCERWDVFREAIEKAKKSVAWEKLSQQQQAEMISKYLQKQYGAVEDRKT